MLIKYFIEYTKKMIFLLFMMVNAVVAQETVLFSNEVTNTSGGDPRTLLQSRDANSTIVFPTTYWASSTQNKTLYYNIYDTAFPEWNVTSGECNHVSGGLVNSREHISVLWISSEGVDVGSEDCITDEYTESGDTAEYVCCFVENLGYMPMYQYHEDTPTTYHYQSQMNNSYIFYESGGSTYNGDIEQCCTQGLVDNSTYCTCSGLCCANDWCTANSFCNVPGAPSPTPQPIQQTPFPTTPTPAPSQSPTVAPTIACTVNSDCQNGGTCVNNHCDCPYPYYGSVCQEIQPCECSAV